MVLSFRDLMRPIALPMLGGLLSAVVLFAMLVPDLAVSRANTSADVPTALFTAASLTGTGYFGHDDHEVVVDVMVDGQGRMLSYNIVTPVHSLELERTIEKNLLFAKFKPATTFGEPMNSVVRVVFLARGDQIDVRG